MFCGLCRAQGRSLRSGWRIRSGPTLRSSRPTGCSAHGERRIPPRDPQRIGIPHEGHPSGRNRIHSQRRQMRRFSPATAFGTGDTQSVVLRSCRDCRKAAATARPRNAPTLTRRCELDELRYSILSPVHMDSVVGALESGWGKPNGQSGQMDLQDSGLWHNVVVPGIGLAGMCGLSRIRSTEAGNRRSLR